MKSKDPIAITHPEVAACWDEELNGDKTPNNITYGCDQKYWWSCPRCGGPWYATARSYIDGHSCATCGHKNTGESVQRPKNYAQSLAGKFPLIAAQWDDELNGDVTPDEVTYGSNIERWWRCPDCYQPWKAAPKSRTGRVQGGGCPDCGPNKINEARKRPKSYKNSLAAKFEKIAAQWHPELNGDKTPEMFTHHSGEQVWWVCECGHEWKATICNRTNGTGIGCLRCTHKDYAVRVWEPACKEDSLAYQRPDLKKLWFKSERDLTPEQVRLQSNEKVLWKCNHCDYQWKNVVFQQAKLRRRGCPICSTPIWTIKKVAYWVFRNWELFSGCSNEERRRLLETTGIGAASGKGRSIVEAVVHGDLCRQDIQNFLFEEEKNVVQSILDNHDPRKYGKRKHIPKATKDKIFARDGHKCKACDRKPGQKRDYSGNPVILVCDHIYPLALMGGDEEENLQTLCSRCNSIKSDRIISLEKIRERHEEILFEERQRIELTSASRAMA